MGENTWKQCNQQGINLQNIQTANTTQYQKKSNLVEKWNHSYNQSRTHNSHDATVQKDGSALSHCKQSVKYKHIVKNQN